ncbi:hypothetical protein Taro_053785 [Colocasia esculenta]|uniref:Retrotransposon gag domain-containing protein n=1 Tax=Colocasia esculenta TaxID=4460 RepID=A0A843XP87_COLES|nr:hypothetical protein [Colocasia esculenta]
MRCPAVDKVVLATYQLRGFVQQWWRLKMQTTFAGRTEEVIAWSEFLEAFNDTFFPLQVQQAKREQLWTLHQGNNSVLEYQMRFMALSRYAPYVVSDNSMMVEYFIRGLRDQLQNALRRQPREQLHLRGLFGLDKQAGHVRVVFGYPSRQQESVRERHQQDLLLQVLVSGVKNRSKYLRAKEEEEEGRGYKPEVEESQQSTARQPTIPLGHRCYNFNQPGHLIRNCPYLREYGYGRGVQQQQPK